VKVFPLKLLAIKNPNAPARKIGTFYANLAKRKGIIREFAEKKPAV